MTIPDRLFKMADNNTTDSVQNRYTDQNRNPILVPFCPIVCTSTHWIKTVHRANALIRPTPVSRFLFSFMFTSSFHIVLPVGNLKVTKNHEDEKKRIVTSAIRFVSCPKIPAFRHSFSQAPLFLIPAHAACSDKCNKRLL